jgi:hypothetical protein
MKHRLAIIGILFINNLLVIFCVRLLDIWRNR